MPVPLALHYIFDPFCGWCYGAAPLLEAAREMDGIRVEFHAGGMLIGDRRRMVNSQWREYAVKYGQRIARVSGQPFGNAYFDGLLFDTTVALDSAPPITAILAAEALAGLGLDMLHELQCAHYVYGRAIANLEVLTDIAAELGLERQSFEAELVRCSGRLTWSHISRSRAFLAAAGGRGFPTFALDDGAGGLRTLEMSDYLGKVSVWRNALKRACVES